MPRRFRQSSQHGYDKPSLNRLPVRAACLLHVVCCLVPTGDDGSLVVIAQLQSHRASLQWHAAGASLLEFRLGTGAQEHHAHAGPLRRGQHRRRAVAVRGTSW